MATKMKWCPFEALGSLALITSMPHMENGQGATNNLNNKMMKEICKDFKIQHHNSMPYRPKMNRAIEVANKNIEKIV